MACSIVSRRRLSVLSVLAFIFVCCCAVCGFGVTVYTGGDVDVIDRCGRGALLEVNGQKVLLLAGAPYQMGYQQGRMLKGDVAELVDTVINVSRTAEAANPDHYIENNLTLDSALARTLPFIPEHYLREMQGLADGAGIPYHRVLLANIFPEMFHCSGFAMFGRATTDGGLIHGRILDYMTGVGLQDHAVLTVVKPDIGHAFVTVGYAGFIGSVTAMNDQQIAMGQMGGGGYGHWDGMPMSFLIREIMQEAENLEEATAILRDTPGTCEYYYVVSDGKVPDARAYASMPDEFFVLEPGQSHRRIPRSVQDAVLVSGGSRYGHLADRVESQFGRIDAMYALDLMNRPVAMESCLHRVLFMPQSQELYVSHAASAGSTEQISAAYQPYYHYRWLDLLAMVADQTPDGVDEVPQAGPLPEVDLESIYDDTESQETVSQIHGIVPASRYRPIAHSEDPCQERLLQAYRVPAEDFEYSMTLARQLPAYSVYHVQFSSAYVSPHPANNTVYCEYFSMNSDVSRGAVILLPHLDGDLALSRVIAHTLVTRGIDACIMVLPYYGARQGDTNIRRFGDSADLIVPSVQQAVVDTRRTASWLTSRANVDPRRIGICGVSLGGMIGALTIGVDGNFPRAVLVVAGGDLSYILTAHSGEVARVRQQLADRGITIEQLRQMLQSIEPLAFANRMRNTRVLMLNADDDSVIPTHCSQALADAAGADIRWFSAGHESMAEHIMTALQLTVDHFSPAVW